MPLLPLLRMPKNTRLYFTNFTIYFAVIVTSRWSRPDFRSLIQWTVPRLFFLFTDAPHTLIPRQWWYMGWLIGSIVCIEITKTSHNANHLSCYKMSHNTTKISRHHIVLIGQTTFFQPEFVFKRACLMFFVVVVSSLGSLFLKQW